MKKLALMALVLSFTGLVLAGCPQNNAPKADANKAPTNAPANAENKG